MTATDVFLVTSMCHVDEITANRFGIVDFLVVAVVTLPQTRYSLHKSKVTTYKSLTLSLS